VFVVYLLITILAYISIIQIVLPRIHMDMKDYFIHVLKPCACVLFLSLITPIIMKQLTGPGILFSFLTITITVIITGVLCFTLGIDKEMRKLIISKVRKIKGGRSL
jgi:threonine/homoserine/homoserine lactone efflux protein